MGVIKAMNDQKMETGVTETIAIFRSEYDALGETASPSKCTCGLPSALTLINFRRDAETAQHRGLAVPGEFDTYEIPDYTEFLISSQPCSTSPLANAGPTMARRLHGMRERRKQDY